MTLDDKNTSVASPQTARHRVREDVRRLILNGELRPGTRLTQQQLAKRFGVAQSVVRESLLELQFSGLVRSVDNLGIFVNDLDTGLLLQAYQVREMIEGLAARLSCERASRADIRELYEMVEAIYRNAVDHNDPDRGQIDRRFHHRIILISQNVVLARLTEAYHVLGTVLTASRNHDDIRREHTEIVKAIEDNKPEEAERVARLHVAAVRKAIEEQIATGKFTPNWVID
jgi:DNA-binding GntR family transcriptional regulator